MKGKVRYIILIILMLGFSSMFFVSCASVDAKEHMEKQHSETFKYVGNTEQGYIFESKSKSGLYVEAKMDKDGNCFDNYELRRTEHDFSTKLSEVFDEDISFFVYTEDNAKDRGITDKAKKYDSIDKLKKEGIYLHSFVLVERKDANLDSLYNVSKLIYKQGKDAYGSFCIVIVENNSIDKIMKDKGANLSIEDYLPDYFVYRSKDVDFSKSDGSIDFPKKSGFWNLLRDRGERGFMYE